MNTKIILTATALFSTIVGSDAQISKTMKNQSNPTAQGQVIKKGKMIYSEIKINAKPEKVWQILTDFNDYPNWNPFIKSISGEPKVGQKIQTFIKPPGANGMNFKPAVLQFIPNKEFRWIGTVGIPFVFDGEHTFKLNDNGDGTTTFIQYEHFRGVMVPFATKMLDENSLQGFHSMNAKLKEMAEM